MNRSARMQKRAAVALTRYINWIICGALLLVGTELMAADSPIVDGAATSPAKAYVSAASDDPLKLSAREMPEQLININTATAAELAIALPGIGPQKAQRIVEWRNTHGPFQYREQLLDVHGIGLKTLERLEGLYHLGDGAVNLGLAPAAEPVGTAQLGSAVLSDIIARVNHDAMLAKGALALNAAVAEH